MVIGEGGLLFGPPSYSVASGADAGNLVRLGRPVHVNTTPQTTCFRGAKCVHKMATGKSDVELLQHDNKMRIWTRSGKVENLWLGDKAQRERQ